MPTHVILQEDHRVLILISWSNEIQNENKDPKTLSKPVTCEVKS